MSNIFPVRLKALRIESGKTQNEIAELINIKRSTYGEYERGKITPPIEKIEQLASVLNTTPQYLMGWESSVQDEGIGSYVKKIREGRQYSIEDMSDKLDIPPKLLEEYETGARKVPYSIVKKVSEFFNIDLIQLYGLEFETDENNFEYSIYRLKQAERWNKAIGKERFTEDELVELMTFAKYLFYRRSQKDT